MPLQVRNLSGRASLLAVASVMMLLAANEPAHAETLGQAVAAAYGSNPNWLAQRAALRALDEEYVQARATLGLQVTAAVSENAYRVDRASSSENAVSQTNQLAVTQPLFTSGRASAQLQGVEARILSRRASLRRVEIDLLTRAAGAYIQFRRDDAILKVSQGAESWLTQQLQDTQDKFSVRQVTLTDVEQAKGRLSAARTALFNAQAQLSLSRSEYTAIVGHPPDALEPEPPFDRLPDTLEAALDVAEVNSPVLKGALYTANASRLGVAEARAQRLFSINARMDYRNGPSSPASAKMRSTTMDTALSLTQPLFSSGQLNSAVRQSLEERDRDEHFVDDARRNISLNVTQSWEQLVAARRTLTTVEQEMQAATEAFFGVRQEERLALRSSIEVLNAQAELQAAQTNFLRGRFNEYYGRVQLLAQLGTLSVGDFAPDTKPYDAAKNFEDVRYRGLWPVELLVRVYDSSLVPMLKPSKRRDREVMVRPASTVLPPPPIAAGKVVAPTPIDRLPAKPPAVGEKR